MHVCGVCVYMLALCMCLWSFCGVSSVCVCVCVLAAFHFVVVPSGRNILIKYSIGIWF